MNSKNTLDNSKKIESFYDDRSLEWKNLYEKKLYPSDVAKIRRGEIATSFTKKYIKDNSKILDAGCGAGKVALDIVKNNRVEGVDISKKMIELCNKEFINNKIDKEKYEFRAGNIFKLDFKKESYDGIIALGFLEYQNDENKSLKFLYDLLKPNGYLILSGPNNLRLYNYFNLVTLIEKIRQKLSLSKKLDYQVDWESICLHKYSVNRFKKLLISNKFVFIDHTEHAYAGLRYINKLIGIKGQFFLYSIFSKFFNLIKVNRFSDDIVIVAKKIKN